MFADDIATTLASAVAHLTLLLRIFGQLAVAAGLFPSYAKNYLDLPDVVVKRWLLESVGVLQLVVVRSTPYRTSGF